MITKYDRSTLALVPVRSIELSGLRKGLRRLRDEALAQQSVAPSVLFYSTVAASKRWPDVLA